MSMYSISICSKKSYVKYGCMKHFDVAVSLNHDTMTSFWIHISDPEPQTLAKLSIVDISG